MLSFTDSKLNKNLISTLTRLGFHEPTPIQKETIDLVLNNKDVLATAQTGTGKTGAYAIPLVSKLLESPDQTALILLPTRELAAQVDTFIRSLVAGSKLSTTLVIGGLSMRGQANALYHKPNVIIGTPGRILDHLQCRSLNLSNIKLLVLDEADRMLDMGFSEALKAIASYIPSSRQTLLFSATLPNLTIQLTKYYLKDPVRINVGAINTPNSILEQKTIMTQENEKYLRLVEILAEYKKSTIVFVKTKIMAKKLAEKLRREGHNTVAFYGSLTQSNRNAIISAFLRKQYTSIVATDVLSRGIDISHIQCVVNYNLPANPEDYVHRVGRTARAGAKGTAITLVTPHEARIWNSFLKTINSQVLAGKKHNINVA